MSETTTERKLIVRDETLFHPAQVVPVYPLVTPLSFGLVKAYRLPMEEGSIYLVDAGFNDTFIYDVRSAGHRDKYFWKLNLQENPILQAKRIPSEFDISIEVPEIPSFDPQFDTRGGWITMKYNVRARLRVRPEAIGQLHQAANPLTTVQNAVRRTVRQQLPFVRYEEALIASCEEEVERQLLRDESVKATGLELVAIEIEAVEGSKTLNESLQESFQRLSEARDKRDIALEFKELDESTYTLMLEYEAPEKALEVRTRVKDQMLEAMLTSGRSLHEIASVAGWAAENIEENEGLAAEIGVEALKRIEEWPTPQIPTGVSHAERLQWERELLKERVPAQFKTTGGSSDTFLFELETGDELKIIWWAQEPPPEVLINDIDRRADFASLRKGVFNYDRVTAWDIYWETRKILGVRDG